MRRPAESLDVNATSLYWHVSNRDDLLDLALDAVFGEIPLPRTRSSWREDLTAFMRGLRAALLAHPWSAVLAGSRPLIGPNALARSEFVYTALTSAGLRGADLADHLSTLHTDWDDHFDRSIRFLLDGLAVQRQCISLDRHILVKEYKAVDAFAVLADPTRRRILDQLRESDRTVGELVTALAVSQPTMSKHLKVLREAGFLSCQVSAQHRIYRIEPSAFRTLDAWLAPYRELWTRHLDALERHLDAKEQ
ncbi:metalloregulator ArsR/SmtB family transcription factor [Saccharopolyspora taberi]